MDRVRQVVMTPGGRMPWWWFYGYNSTGEARLLH